MKRILKKKIGPLYQNKNRINAINEAIQNGANVAIMDDGFQDFSINKNLSIICFNEKLWIGNGLLIPSGPLREGLSALKRADCVIINGNKNKKIESRIISENEDIKIFYTNYKPENIEEFKNKKVTAFAGIGSPENFFDLLKNHSIDVFRTIKFPDHYIYSKKEMDNLINNAIKNNTILLTTEKDYFRINEEFRKNIGCLKISIEIENRNKFIEEIKKII